MAWTLARASSEAVSTGRRNTGVTAPQLPSCPRLSGSLDNRNMLCRTARQSPVKPRIVSDFDLSPKRAEARPPIESQRARMIEGAGVHPEARDGLRPRPLQRAVHQKAAGTGADQFRGDAEQGQLALAGGAEIQMQQALVPAIGQQGVYF